MDACMAGCKHRQLSYLPVDRHRKLEFWRYITTDLVHAELVFPLFFCCNLFFTYIILFLYLVSWNHVLGNVILKLFYGWPVEHRRSWLETYFIYAHATFDGQTLLLWCTAWAEKPGHVGYGASIGLFPKFPSPPLFSL
jgi:hypothetical protein